MEECSHEAETSNLLFGQSEGTDVGAMAMNAAHAQFSSLGANL
jgi:hypothetical protein